MERDTKLGYGFLFAGVPVAYVIEHFLKSPTAAFVVLAILAGLGIFFLVSGHLHQVPDRPLITRRRKVITWTISAVVFAGLCCGGWSVRALLKEEKHPPTESAALPPAVQIKNGSDGNTFDNNQIIVPPDTTALSVDASKKNIFSGNLIDASGRYIAPEIIWADMGVSGEPSKVFLRLNSTQAITNPRLIVTCDRSCLLGNSDPSPFFRGKPLTRWKSIRSDKGTLILDLENPNPLNGGTLIFMGLRSKDHRALKVLSIKLSGDSKRQ